MRLWWGIPASRHLADCPDERGLARVFDNGLCLWPLVYYSNGCAHATVLREVYYHTTERERTMAQLPPQSDYGCCILIVRVAELLRRTVLRIFVRGGPFIAIASSAMARRVHFSQSV